MITFPKSSVEQWRKWRESPEGHNDRAHLRMGQSFFNWFDCHKVTGKDRNLLDKLYERDGSEAKRIIYMLTDHSQ